MHRPNLALAGLAFAVMVRNTGPSQRHVQDAPSRRARPRRHHPRPHRRHHPCRHQGRDRSQRRNERLEPTITTCLLPLPLVTSRSWKSQLTEGNEIKVDQSSLTGESLPVSKHAGDEAFSGSVVKHGEAEALVHATGTTHHPASCATRARRPRAVIRAPAARCMHRKSNVLWASRGTDRAGVQDGPSPARA